MEPNEDYFWCSFQAHEDKSIAIQCFAIGIQTLTLVALLCSYVKAKKQQKFQQKSDHLVFVYKLIFAWLLCFSLQSAVNVGAYFVYIEQSPFNISNELKITTEQEANSIELRLMSGIDLFLDVMSAFFMQMIMLYIPYLWMKNYLQLLPQQNLKVNDRVKINRISWFLGLIRKYLKFRYVYIVYFIFTVVMVIVTDIFKNYSMYITIPSLIQSIVILVIYPMGLWAWNFISKHIDIKKQQLRSMFKEYIILLLCNVVRIVVNILLYFSGLVDYQPDKYCYDDHDEANTIMNCLFLVFTLTLMHILPAIIILYVYWPSAKNKISLRKSLLVTSYQNCSLL